MFDLISLYIKPALLYAKFIIFIAIAGYIGYCELRILGLKDKLEDVEYQLKTCDIQKSTCEQRNAFMEDNYRRLQKYAEERGELDLDGEVTPEMWDKLKKNK